MNKIYILILVSILGATTLFSQSTDNVKYRRSSLHLMMMEDAKLPEKDIIVNTFNNYPFPDKYNDHKIETIIIPNFINDDAKEAKEELKKQKKSDKESGVKLSDEEKKKRKLIKSLKGADKTIEKYFNDNKVANQIVAKWFNMQKDGVMDFNLIADRGKYDATQMDVKIAGKMTKNVSSQLTDAGVELIDKTFVIINKFRFVNNEIKAAIAYGLATVIVESLPDESKIEQVIKNKAAKIAKKNYEKYRKGYSVTTQAILYKLDWSKSVHGTFFNEYFTDSNFIASLSESERTESIKNFQNTDLFQLKLVGMEKQTIRVLNLTSEDLNKQQIIDEATKRTMNKVYVKLQKEYDIFKPSMPLLTASKKDCTAKIGMKEGLEGGEKFEVLEQIVDKNGLTIYKNKGTIKVNKKQLWDNQFYAAEPPVKKGKKEIITATGFKGCKNSFYKGMLIRQIK
tara:strand:- start:2353 stop:3714 length:1362 start_codon:yes stop_codon:yes gene_type:complete